MYMCICKYLCVVHQLEYASLVINHAVFYNNEPMGGHKCPCTNSSVAIKAALLVCL